MTGELDLTKCPELSTLNIYIEEEEEEDEQGSGSDSKTDASTEGETNEGETTEDETTEDETEGDENTEEKPEEEAKVGITKLVIKNLKKLTSVNAYGNALTAVPELDGCEKLTSLTLNDNLITDVSGAAKDTDGSKDGVQTVLTTLNLAGNKITDISALEKVTSLTSLTLSDNDITNIDAIGKLTALKTLNLDGNKNLNTLLPIMENFAKTSSLTINIIGTKVASDKVTIEEFQKKFSTMKLTYVEKTENK